MRPILTTLVLGAALALAGCPAGDGHDDHDHAEHAEGEQTAMHWCPMHPGFIQVGPGTCDICGGMELEIATYTCPMHPDVQAEGPGTCPECDMALQPSVYACPMHPDVKQAEPGECPECGMALELMDVGGGEGDEASGDGGEEPEGS